MTSYVCQDTAHIAGDINLAEEISAPDIVPTYRLTTGKISDSLIAPSIFPKRQLCKDGGFVNFVRTKYSVVRSFQPYNQIGTRNLSCFAVKIIERFSPADALYLEKGDRLPNRSTIPAIPQSFPTTHPPSSTITLIYKRHSGFDQSGITIVSTGVATGKMNIQHLNA